MEKYTIGLDIGGTKCAVLLGRGEIPVRCDDFILDRAAFPTESKKGLEQALQKLYRNIEEMMEKHRLVPADILGIGVSCGGPLDSKKGIIMGPPNLYGWDYVPIVQMLQERYRIPAHVQNDANACALAEWRFGAARGTQNAVFLTFGTGMGAGLILDGRLYSGTSDMAGEVGHMRLAEDGPVGFGKSQVPLKAFAAAAGSPSLPAAKPLRPFKTAFHPLIALQWRAWRPSPQKPSLRPPTQAMPPRKRFTVFAGKSWAWACALITDIINPEIIVIGSIFERSHSLLWPAAKEVWGRVSASLFSTLLQRSFPRAQGILIGDYAALSVAFQPS